MMTLSPDQERQLLCRMAFASLRGINYTLAHEFLLRLGSEDAFFDASEQSLIGMTGGIASHLFNRDFRNAALEKARRELDFVLANSIKCLYHTDPDFPQRVRDTDDGPLMLYSLGNINLNPPATIAIVGTRHATAYGVYFVDNLIKDLAEKLAIKPLIVSGLAFGIDIAAHRAALREGLPTAAVLAHGLNMIYPAVHRSTAAEMAHSGGALLTDYMSSDPVHKGNFRARNRIVAGIADALIVVESATKGGSLLTARIAAGYCRDVFALPGRISDRYSSGCNSLISRSEAHLITSADDLIDAMNWPRRDQEPRQLELFPQLDPDDQAIIDYLVSNGESRANEIAIALNRPIGKMMASLVDLEFKGRVTAFPGGLYRPG